MATIIRMSFPLIRCHFLGLSLDPLFVVLLVHAEALGSLMTSRTVGVGLVQEVLDADQDLEKEQLRKPNFTLTLRNHIFELFYLHLMQNQILLSYYKSVNRSASYRTYSVTTEINYTVSILSTLNLRTYMSPGAGGG